MCLSSYKSCKLKVKLWWVRARERKKMVFFVPFILSKWNFCTIYLFSKLSDKFSLSLMRESLHVHMSASFVSTCCAVFPNVPSRCGLFQAQHLVEEVNILWIFSKTWLFKLQARSVTESDPYVKFEGKDFKGLVIAGVII